MIEGMPDEKLLVDRLITVCDAYANGKKTFPSCEITHPNIADVSKSPFKFRFSMVTTSQLKDLVRQSVLDITAVKNATATDDKDLPDECVTHELTECWTVSGWEYIVIDRKILGRAAKAVESL